MQGLKKICQEMLKIAESKWWWTDTQRKFSNRRYNIIPTLFKWKSWKITQEAELSLLTTLGLLSPNPQDRGYRDHPSVSIGTQRYFDHIW